MLIVRLVEYSREIEQALDVAKSVDIGVAFATVSGLRFSHIKRKLTKLLQSGGHVRVLVDLRLGNTEPAFLEDLIQWQEDRLPLELRAYTAEAAGIFHPKLYIFHFNDGKAMVISGSANWTRPAFSTNIEHGIALEGDFGEPAIASVTQLFESWWSSTNSKPIDANTVRLYQGYYQRRHALEAKARSRATRSWRRVQTQLEATLEPGGFRWPSGDAAFLLGVLAARGSIESRSKRLLVTFKYGGRNYSHNGRRGYIGKGNVSYDASQVVPLVSQFVANRLRQVVSPATLSIKPRGNWTYELEIDCGRYPRLIDDLRPFFGAARNYYAFPIPREVLTAGRDDQEDFMRGYALACGLVSSGTYDPTMNHQVWLRPATVNTKQFDQLVDLLQKSLGVSAHRHQRADRDVAIKIRCEAWLHIGFGVGWLDAIVEEGARLNGALS